MTQGRLLRIDASRSASDTADREPGNMSIDQAILESVDAGEPPTLRFYRWPHATLSLGYFQKLAARQQHLESQPLPVVRRSTGGGAIVHHHELTYSLAVPLIGQSMGGRLQLYQQVHDGIREMLQRLGIATQESQHAGGRLSDHQAFLCFQRRNGQDLVCCGYKVLGSAQRRGRQAILQHGSLLLRSSEFAPQLPGVLDLVPRQIAIGELQQMIAEQLAGRLRIRWADGNLGEKERYRASVIETERFGSTGWLQRR